MLHHDATTSLLTSDVSQPAGSQTMEANAPMDTECLLEIAREVRSHVGVTVPNKCLCDQQLHEAWHFLQREIFEKKYMYNCDLRDKIEAYRRDPHSFNRTKTQQLSKTRRSVFKAWVHNLIGDRTLFANLVRHGRWFTDNAFPIRTFWCKNHVVLEAPQKITIPVSNHHKEISIQFSRTPVHTIWSRRQYQLTPGKLPQRISENTETTFDEWMSWEVL